MDEKIQNLIRFHCLAITLKDKIRSGWQKWHVEKARLESVAEHIYGTCILAIAIDSEFKLDIDLGKVLKMLVLHELEEIIIGDITPYDNISKEEKLKIGKDAVNKILEGLVKKEEYEALLDEFNNHKTKDAKFAFQCDKLEADIQAKIYDDNVDIFSANNTTLREKDWNQKAISEGAKHLSDLFINYDMTNYDNIFKNIAKHIKTNKFIEVK